MAVLAVSYRLRDTMAILIVGLMFGSLTSAIVGTLTFSVLLSNYKNLPLVLGNLGIYPGHPLEFYSFAY
jgi:iron complex transport system permease protein